MKIELSEHAHAVVCGLVQPSDDVHAEGVLAPDEVWEEIRRSFPLGTFQAAVDEGRVEYNEED